MEKRGRGLVEFVIVGGRSSPMCLVSGFALSENPGIALMLGQASGLRMQVDYQISIGQGNGRASAFGMIRIAVILHSRYQVRWALAICMYASTYVHLWGHI